MRGKAPLCKEAVLVLFAERFGWTPEQSKCISNSEAKAILHIIRTKDKINEFNNKK